MASSRKKRSRAVVTLLLCLAAVCIVAALVLYGLANRKLKALQQGADFEFTYAVTSQGGTTHPALYSILDQAGATEGRMTGQRQRKRLKARTMIWSASSSRRA